MNSSSADDDASIFEVSGSMAFFSRLTADLLLDKTENADLRTSRFFPATASIHELQLDEGTYTLQIHYYGAGNKLLHSDERTEVHLEAGRLNVIESAYLN